MLSHFSCVQFFATPWTSLPGTSVHGIFQARVLEWVAIPSSRGLLNLGIKPTSVMPAALAGGFFTTSATYEAQA